MPPYRVSIFVSAATVLASAPLAECSRLLESSMFSAEWKEPQYKKSCYDSRLGNEHFHSLDAAKSACEARPTECGAVYNYHGKGKRFYLCRRGVAYTDSITGESSVHEMEDGPSQGQAPEDLEGEQEEVEQLHKSESAESVLAEWKDEGLGIGFSMVSKKAWGDTRWGIVKKPSKEHMGWAQSYVSIMTHKQPMKVYRGRSYGLVFHIGPSYDFWKYFQVIAKGDGIGNIVGGPYDGGSHTTPSYRAPAFKGAKWNGEPVKQPKDYAWFKDQKDAILANFNTKYKIQDYNEFITNGLSSQAIAGVLHFTGNHKESPSDYEMCNFLCWRAGIGSWPVFAYSAWEEPKGSKQYHSSLTIERYLDCTADAQYPPEEYGCNQ